MRDPSKPRMPKSGAIEPREPNGSRFDMLMNANLDALQPTEQKVMRHIDRNRLATLSTSAAELAHQVGASDATVVRAVKALGFKGLSDLRAALADSLAEGVDPASNLRRTAAAIGEDVERAVADVFDTHAESLRQAGDTATRSAIVRAVCLLDPAKRILVFGIGLSAGLAHYISTLLNRHGRRSAVIDATGSAMADQLLDLGPGDALLVLAYGRIYREVDLVFDEAKRLRLPLILVSDSLDRTLSDRADVIVPARRGRHGHIALHGVTLIVLEAIVLGLTFVDPDRALNAVSRIGMLREMLKRD